MKLMSSCLYSRKYGPGEKASNLLPSLCEIYGLPIDFADIIDITDISIFSQGTQYVTFKPRRNPVRCAKEMVMVGRRTRALLPRPVC